MNKRLLLLVTIVISLLAIFVLAEGEVPISDEVIVDIEINDSNGEDVEFVAEILEGETEDVIAVIDSDLPTIEIVEEGEHKVVVEMDDGPVETIIFEDLNVSEKTVVLGVDDVPEEKIEEVEFVEVYAIDPEEVPFTNATVTATAKGTALYKCKDWNFEEQACYGEWKFLQDIIPGEEYSFELTPHDPGFGEINASDAVHLNETYGFINNIFDEIKAVDANWSEAIYTDEYVRVTFVENLTDGRMIDILARSNGTLTYFEIYEEGTTHLVGKSGVIDYPEVQFIPVTGLTGPTDVFDFKVLRVNSPLEEYTQCLDEGYLSCDEDPYEGCYGWVEESCDSPIYHHNRTAFLEFDFIHDDVINSTHADGIISYGEANVATPRYRKWNDTNDFEAESSAQSVGTDTVNDITWAVVKGNHERNEIILGTYDKGNDINVQVFDSSTWGNLQEVTATAENSAYRGFDIAYEDLSGDALIVYENSDAADSIIGYRTWDGTSYSAETNLTTLLASGEVHWISLVENIGSDDIMLLVHNNLNDLYAIPWNGTDFLPSLDIELSAGTTSITEEHFAFAWEESSGQGLVAYSEGTDFVYRTYDPVGGFGSTENTITMGAHNLDTVRMCSEPTSDYIGIIVHDSGRDINVRVWDGSSILAGAPSQDGGTENNGANNANSDCAWVNSTNAIFGFVDRDALSMDWVEFSKANTWSTSDLTSTSTTSNFATNDIKSLRFTEHPTTQEVMIVAMDIAEDVTTIYWNGTEIITPSVSLLESTTEVTNGAQEGVMFDWFRYDPVPNVTSVGVNGSSFSTSEIISINATVVDNIAVGSVLANITLPNSTIEQIVLTDENGDDNYNLSYSQTGSLGLYTVTIIANDTSTHKNINSSETTTFSVVDSNNPAVSNFSPSINTVFNISNTTEVTVNVTDDSAVDVVIANLSYPNGTINELVLGSTSGDKYNTSFILPYLIGNYNITFFANDTGNNVNNSETSNFTINDVVTPNVTNIVPVINTDFNVSDAIEIAANVTDDLSVDVVIANLSYPNGTINELVLGSTSGDKYNASFISPALTGSYNITIFANDTSNNVNNTGVSNFTVSTVNTLTITSMLCSPSSANLTQSILCSSNVADDIGVHTVTANVTMPNGTVLIQTVTNVSSNYSFTFTDTAQKTGLYNVSWGANDTSSNEKNDSTNFTVSDVTFPKWFLHTADELNSSSASVDFNFSVEDNFDTSINCSL